jgi:hypothetical protein
MTIVDWRSRKWKTTIAMNDISMSSTEIEETTPSLRKEKERLGNFHNQNEVGTLF